MISFTNGSYLYTKTLLVCRFEAILKILTLVVICKLKLHDAETMGKSLMFRTIVGEFFGLVYLVLLIHFGFSFIDLSWKG